MIDLQSAPWWAYLLAVLLTGASGGGIYGLMRIWFEHQRAKRKQTDEVAMEMVKRLDERVKVLEADATRLQADIRILEGWDSDWLMLLFRFTPIDRQSEMIAEVAELRDRRRGERRQAQQVGLSFVRAVQDGPTAETA